MVRQSNTCILIVKDPELGLVFSSERRSLANLDISLSPVAKVAKRNNILFAATGEGSLCHILTNIVPVAPYYRNTDTPLNYVYNNLYPGILEYLDKLSMFSRESGHLKSDKDEMDTNLLVGIGGRLFTLGFFISRPPYIDELSAPYSDGCGGAFALGAYKALEKSKAPVKVKIRRAMKIAAECSAGCDNNIDILCENED